MALDLHLEDSQVEVLDFILGTTIDRWEDEGPTQREIMADDPSYKTFEELTEATGSLNELLERAKALRTLINLPDVT